MPLLRLHLQACYLLWDLFLPPWPKREPNLHKLLSILNLLGWVVGNNSQKGSVVTPRIDVHIILIFVKSSYSDPVTLRAIHNVLSDEMTQGRTCVLGRLASSECTLFFLNIDYLFIDAVFISSWYCMKTKLKEFYASSIRKTLAAIFKSVEWRQIVHVIFKGKVMHN